jgi:hypothetical protein
MNTITITDLSSFDWLLGELEGHLEVLEDDGDITDLTTCEMLQEKLSPLGLGTHQVELSGDELEQLKYVLENCVECPDEFDINHVTLK